MVLLADYSYYEVDAVVEDIVEEVSIMKHSNRRADADPEEEVISPLIDGHIFPPPIDSVVVRPLLSFLILLACDVLLLSVRQCVP